MKPSLASSFACVFLARIAFAAEPATPVPAPPAAAPPAATPTAPSAQADAPATGAADASSAAAAATSATPATGAAAPAPASGAENAAAAPGAASAPSVANASEPVAPSANDASLDSFSTESGAENEAQRHIELYGFADFSYQRLFVPKGDPWKSIYTGANSFAVGNFNLYMSSQLSDSWRALAEVRFMYLPNGQEANAPGGATTRTDTTVTDYAGFSEPIRWGGIHIERVWLEYSVSALLKIQAGQFLTPYGIWNVDHGSPTVIGVKKPFVVQDNLFPNTQVGFQAYGSHFFDPVEVGYHLTISNGRGPVEYLDYSDDKAYGGRLYVKTDALGSLTVGGSFYRGNYYDRTKQYSLRNDAVGPVITTTFTTTTKYRELSLGGDVKWQYENFLVQGEAIMNDAAFASGGRPIRTDVGATGFTADYRRWGYYGLVGYRTPFLQTMPYVILQHAVTPDDPRIPPATGYEIGLNVRPIPAVVLKVEYIEVKFGRPDTVGLGRYPLRFAASQIAWAF